MSEPGLLPLSPREARWLDSPDGMARLLWRRYHRALRLAVRAEIAQLDHEVLWGDPRAERPLGILHF